ncbi:MAG TPA: MBL fold metallo-hydrolase, partial [Longimicrobium sp.]|nr:MBL fold metallo-hydrolase [Longimicrobium sp.]
MLQTILAPNPSPMTLDGTRTLIVGRERAVVIDPGPDDPAHVDAILAALGGRAPMAILLTHSHGDHSAAARPRGARTGAPRAIRTGA